MTHRRGRGPDGHRQECAGLALAEVGGEIVACDSTAVYRGIDIGTDKVPPAEQQRRFRTI